MQDADGFPLRQQGKAEIGERGRADVPAFCRVVSCRDRMPMPGAQSPAVLRREYRAGQATVCPGSSHLEHIARGVEQEHGAGEFRKYFRSHACDHRQQIFQVRATLQQLGHRRQSCRPLRTAGEFLHHALVLLVQFLLRQRALAHFRLQALIRFEQRSCVLLDLLFQQLLIAHLIIDVDAAPEPLDDASGGVAHGSGSNQIPAIIAICHPVAILSIEGLAGLARFIPVLHGNGQVVGMKHVFPIPSQDLFGFQPGKIAQALVAVVDAFPRRCGPHDFGDGLGQ